MELVDVNNLSDFRKSEFLQLEYALATGQTVRNLLDRSEGLHGNTQFNSFLLQTRSSKKRTIDWLVYEECLNASIAGLKQAARKMAELEAYLGFSTFDILEKLKRKHNTSTLEQLFDNLIGEEWLIVTKGEIVPLLKEFNFWLEYIDELELCNDLNGAQELLDFLEQPLFKQLKHLSDIQEISQHNWELDEGVFKNILKALGNSSGNFVTEWLESPNIHSHYNAKTHREYNSLYSFFFLSIISWARGYKSNMWATKKQWQKMGCEIQPDASPAAVFHYFKIQKKNSENDDEITNNSFGRKISIVYNSEQVIGYEGKSFAETKVKELPILEQRIEALKVNIEHSAEAKPAYFIKSDYITMPAKEYFKGKDSTKSYYSTLLHELIHWTGHPSRCCREFGVDFGDSSYAFEELIAEIGSAFLCNRFGLTKNVRVQSIRYIDDWLGKFQIDEKLLQLENAAILANRASSYIYLPHRDGKA